MPASPGVRRLRRRGRPVQPLRQLRPVTGPHRQQHRLGGEGTNGCFSSGIPACSGVRAALRWLSSAQEATVFSQVSCPPWARGTTWSTVDARRPQYAHRCWSRMSTPLLDHGACLRNGTRTYRQSLITRGAGMSTAAPRIRSSGCDCSTTALSVRIRTTARLSVTVDSGSKLALRTNVSRILPTSRVPPAPWQARINSGWAGRDGQRNKKCPALISPRPEQGKQQTN